MSGLDLSRLERYLPWKNTMPWSRSSQGQQCSLSFVFLQFWYAVDKLLMKHVEIYITPISIHRCRRGISCTGKLFRFLCLDRSKKGANLKSYLNHQAVQVRQDAVRWV